MIRISKWHDSSENATIIDDANDQNAEPRNMFFDDYKNIYLSYSWQNIVF